MPFFEILVQHERGHVATKRRVRLGGSNGLSTDEYTDSHGRAVLEFSSSDATLYVDGKDRGRVRGGKNAQDAGDHIIAALFKGLFIPLATVFAYIRNYGSPSREPPSGSMGAA